MLKIKILDKSAEKLWDEINEVFIDIPGAKGCELTLEHSLLSVSKWESIWCKPFLDKKDRSVEETLSYIECMVITPTGVEHSDIMRITQSDVEKINAYINNPATATTITEYGSGSKGRTRDGELITSELIYYWMVAAQVPFECQKWHLNRLLTLLRLCEIKNDPKGQKKRSQNEMRQDYDRLNEARRKALGTKG